MESAANRFQLRPFGQNDREADYQLIERLANYQVPQDPAGNQEWLQNRRAYDQRPGQRRHYIATFSLTQEPIGYAGLEQQPLDSTSYRIYLVFDPQRWPFDALGVFLYQQLLADAYELQAEKLVCIEYANDSAFRVFLEAQRFRHVGNGSYNGFGIVRYEKTLAPSG